MCSGADAWCLSGRTPPDSLYQDCGSDVRHAHLAAIGLEWIPLDPPLSESSAYESKGSPASEQAAMSTQADQPGHIRCRQSTGRSPDGCSCGGIGARNESLSVAMLSTAWHQWQSKDRKSPICPCNHSLKSRECEYNSLCRQIV